MMIIAANDIPCPVCKAAPGERCTFVSNPAYRGEIMRRGCHSRRSRAAADDATHVANVLLDS